MKLVRLLQASAIAAAGALSFSSVSAQEPAAAPATPAAPAAAQLTDEQVFEAFGYVNGQGIVDRINGMADQLQLSAAERAALFKGFASALAGDKDRFNGEALAPDFQRVLGGRQQAVMAKAAEKAKGEADAYFSELKKNNPAVKSTASGLHYEIISEGSGAKPKPSDTVKVNYTGKLVDGSVFDSSEKHGKPAEFQLGGVISGWVEGLQLVGTGGKLKLYIPSDLGYGEQGAGPAIPPNSILVFDVELLEIKGGAAEAK